MKNSSGSRAMIKHPAQETEHSQIMATISSYTAMRIRECGRINKDERENSKREVSRLRLENGFLSDPMNGVMGKER